MRTTSSDIQRRLSSRLSISRCKFAYALLLLLWFCSSLQAATFSGTVIKINDGDTLTILSAKQSYKIRLLAIDAPEHDQAFGATSKQHLADLILGKSVTVTWQQRDSYQRIVGQVFITDPNCKTHTCSNTVDVNLQQVLTGSAWWYRHYASAQTRKDAARYQQAEDQARHLRIGLWSQSQPIAPWLWRRNR